MSAFIPANSNDGGHQPGQIPTSSIGDMYTFPYFPTVINPYGYPINAATGISNAAFPNMNHPSIHMNNMAANLQPNPQIQHLQSDPAFAASLFQNNNFSLYNKNELFEAPATTPNALSINDSKPSSVASIHESVRSGDSSASPNENHSPARAIKPSKTHKQGFKSPDEESAYRNRRQKNNEAARMSRIRRQQREKDLQVENDRLKTELNYWKNKYNTEVLSNKSGVLSELQNR